MERESKQTRTELGASKSMQRADSRNIYRELVPKQRDKRRERKGRESKERKI